MENPKQQGQSITTTANSKLYTYVVARDYGFAPNPFYGMCTLATCKPDIRRTALIGDIIVGVGRAPNNHRLVYWMRVSDAITYDDYWFSERYKCKKPMMQGSLKQAYGDNIYHSDGNGGWIQAQSHHSFEDGTPNQLNIDSDTKTTRMLIGVEFAYWGGDGPVIPSKLRDMCGGRGHRCRFTISRRDKFLNWLSTLGDRGCQGLPGKWSS